LQFEDTRGDATFDRHPGAGELVVKRFEMVVVVSAQLL
jgi:hypothetical protein